MDFNFYYNAKLIKLFVAILLLILFNEISFAQDDPISQDLKQEKQETIGARLNKNEAEELKHINEKYALSDKEKEVRTKQMSGQKIGLIDKYRLGRANRKDYMRNKKFEEFKKKKVLNSQNEKTRNRMIANKKKVDERDKKEKKKKKRKSFFNKFK